MNLGTILVHLDHSEHCVDRVRLAASMANVHGSHLVGLVPTGLYDGRIPADVIATDDTGFMAASADYLRTRAEAVAHVFRNEIRGAGPLSFDVRVVDEPSADAVIGHARCSDLVIVGQGEVADAMTAVDLPAQAVLHAGRPVLIVPRAQSSRKPPKKVLVAWDGSREAGMALRDALPLLSRASAVTLVSLYKGDEAEATDREALLIPQTIAWLQRHGVQAAVQQQAVRGSFADALLSSATRMEVDLVVMGAYGHARLREFVLGGVTHRMLSETSVPVLMAH
jgi:nucleotide-binding universal stress UspA family protein